MNREIKFRVWDLKNLFWFDPKKFNLLGKPLFNPGFYQEFDIQQYTGLKDKNGTEIFEGDILEYSIGSIYREFVKWESGCFYLVTANEDSATPLAGTHVICQVVGNIHENPEFIK